MRRVNLCGNGGGQKEATVELTLKVRDTNTSSSTTRV
jgi:hypothetical protein